MNTTAIRIMLVDDHKLVRDSWKILLENNPSFTVVEECDTGHQAIERASSVSPDVLLVDINMSPLNGFNVTEEVRKRSPGIKVIGLSVNNQPKYATRMLELGARGYLTKTSPLEEINKGIVEVFNGGVYVCKEVKGKMTPEEIAKFL